MAREVKHDGIMGVVLLSLYSRMDAQIPTRLCMALILQHPRDSTKHLGVCLV